VAAERLLIRSYRRVFEVDRRIYRVDRWALPVPGGIPLRGLAYFAATVGLVVVLGALPGVGELVGVVTPPLRFLVLPLAVAVLGTQAAPDGRTAHRFARDWLRLRLRARRRCTGRAVPLEGEPVPWHGVLAARWDAHGAQLRRARVRGPAMVAFAAPVEFRDGPRGRLQARGRAGRDGPQTVVIGGGQVLEVRP
jgi:TcpE family